MIPIISRQSSDPYLVERREYYDGPTSVIEERTLVRPSRPVSRASSRSVRVVQTPQRRLRVRREELHREEEHYARPAPRRQVFEEEDWYATTRRGRSRDGYERSRSRVSTYEDGNDHTTRHPSMLRAPSPPPIGSSSLGYIEPRPHHEEIEVTRSREHEAIDRRGRPATWTSRRRSRSRSVAGPVSTFLRPGDSITVIERDDYDAFDRDGMRVRVREI